MLGSKQTAGIVTENAINTEDQPFLSYAKCGDLEIGAFCDAHGIYHVVGAQIEEDLPVEIYRHCFVSKVEALRFFAESVIGEYAGA